MLNSENAAKKSSEVKGKRGENERSSLELSLYLAGGLLLWNKGRRGVRGKNLGWDQSHQMQIAKRG